MISKIISLYRISLAAFLIVGLSVVVGCDDSNSVVPRFNNHFIKYYGGTGNNLAADVIITSDGGYLLVGTSDPDRSFDDAGGDISRGDEDIFVVKTDDSGNEEWSAIYDFGAQSDFGLSVVEVATGYLIVGNSDNDGLFINIDLSGVELLSDTINLGGQEVFERVDAVSDGFMLVGSTTNTASPGLSDPSDIVSVKLTPTYEIDTVWRKNNNEIRGREGGDRGIRAFEINNTIAVYGYTDNPPVGQVGFDQNTFMVNQHENNSFLTDGFMGDTEDQVMTDAVRRPGDEVMMIGTLNGNEIYFLRATQFSIEVQSGTLFSELGVTLRGTSIASSTDNQILVLGDIEYINGDVDIFLGKADVFGGSVWSNTFGGTGIDEAARVIQNPDGSIIILGTMNLSGQKKVALIKTNSEGQLNLE